MLPPGRFKLATNPGRNKQLRDRDWGERVIGHVKH